MGSSRKRKGFIERGLNDEAENIIYRCCCNYFFDIIIIGRNSAENVPEQAQETVAEMPETYIDTEEIESATIGTEGLELKFSDGTGYYIETDVTPDRGYINVNDIKGWETWNDNEKVYLSVGDWVISKEPYTTNTKAERME